MTSDKTESIEPLSAQIHAMDVLDLSTAQRPLPRDIKGKRVIGTSHEDTIPGNFIDCLLDDCCFKNTYFDTTDFTNCVLQNVLFDECNMHQGSITGCAFVECRFIDTEIALYALHDCIFTNTCWRRLKFRNSLVRHSRVHSSEILDSFVTNQVFDECILLDSHFRDTLVDFSVILKNFGVSQDAIDTTLLRPDRSEKNFPESDDFENIMQTLTDKKSSLSYVDRFKIQYYLSNGFNFDGYMFDNIFNKTAWYNVALTPGSLTRALEQFSELILHSYNKGLIELHGIARLHELSNNVYQELRDSHRYGSIAQTAVGIHVRTGDVINNFEDVLVVLADKMRDGQYLHFRTTDGVTETELSELAETLSHFGLVLKFRTIRRNSPLDLIASPTGQTFLFFAALFVLTRFEFELREISRQIQTSEVDHGSEGIQLITDAPPLAEGYKTDPPILNLGVGFQQESSEPLLSLTSRAPGQTLVKVSVSVNTAIIRRVRRALYHIFMGNGDSSEGV